MMTAKGMSLSVNEPIARMRPRSVIITFLILSFSDPFMCFTLMDILLSEPVSMLLLRMRFY